MSAKKPKATPPKIAIVHDWLVGGGAEKVVLELHRMFPDAPIYTSYCTNEWRDRLDGKVVTGYLQHIGKFRKFLPLLQYRWFQSLKLDEYDVILSSAGNGMAKAIRKPAGARHICYCHTPVHYLWRHYDHYLSRPGFGPFNGIARLGLKLLAAPLRKLDYLAAQDVDQFIANSTHIKADIKKYYGKDATVIFPPINTARFSSVKSTVARRGFITVGRLVPMKRIDIIIQACNELELPLTVVGDGPERAHLEAIAGPTIRMLGKVSEEKMGKEFAGAEAFIFASFEDFGMAPVEAMAAGLPVIAYKAGGALDYVIPGKTGEFFPEQTAESIITALGPFNSSKYQRIDIENHAHKYSNEGFQKKINKIL